MRHESETTMSTITAVRSSDPRDFQDLDQTVAAMAKSCPAGFQIRPHSHKRDQLLYAVSGTMRIRTASDAWIVPPDRALFLPAGVVHSVSMREPVEMRTLYIARRRGLSLPRAPVVLVVTPLLKALVLALLEEPIAYAPRSRADHIALLILDEITRAKPLEMSIPMPRDARLLRLCEALIGKPELAFTLDGWTEHVGASRRTLARLFRQECGITFTAWRQRVRFHAAIEALSRGATVSEAARQSGYESPSAFTSAFRKSFGFSPRGISSAGVPHERDVSYAKPRARAAAGVARRRAAFSPRRRRRSSPAAP
jgi:AraC-like DNA-binding protein/mannose-6-phosphate isomerase-like protein (cupin superfamily)